MTEEQVFFYMNMLKAEESRGIYISAIDIAISALEKQIPKKVNKEHVRYGSPFFCPECDAGISPVYFMELKDGIVPKGVPERKKTSWCSNCGQKIDWSAEKDE